MGIKPVLLIAQVINFLILILALKIFLYKPILEILEKRRKKIEESLTHAEKVEKDAAKTEEFRKKTLQKAQAQGEKIIDKAKKRADFERRAILEETHQEAEAILAKARHQAEVDKEKIIDEAKKQIVEFVSLALFQILKKDLDKDTQIKLVEKAVEGLEKVYKKPKNNI